ncbi:MAG: pseudouridylate synthase specific to ribosomal small subunit, rRNA pseudouridine2604 synthase [Candidatus Parcubacteria bacterium]|jgi:pseudouridine synthase
MKIEVDLSRYGANEKKTGIRINKFLADYGIASRREADKLIENKKIHIKDRVALLGEKVFEGDTVVINKKLEKFRYFLYNKKRGEETIYKQIDGIRYDPIGRLDKESEGLLIYSNDYTIVEKLLNPINKIEREYHVLVREKATPRVKAILEKGIATEEGQYAPAKNVILDEENRNIIKIILVEGKKHEIRRMLNALNLTIISLKRVRFDFLKIKDLWPGKIRELTEIEKEKLLKI